MRTYDSGAIEVYKRARLPHWSAEHGIHGVTFNLVDAIPREVAERVIGDSKARLAAIAKTRGTPTHAETAAIQQWVNTQLNKTLDEGHGSCAPRDPRIAQLVTGAFEFFDSVRYDLYSWCLMPNHAHLVFGSHPEWPLEKVMHSWKSYTSKEANKTLGRRGEFWQHESFDRTIRNSRHLERAVAYVVNNPVNAGLLDWPWVKAYPERIAAVMV